jgi:hypothetical protein
MSPTWDEYLTGLSDYLIALGQASQAGFACAPAPPARPQGPFPEDRRDEASRLVERCERLARDMSARMAALANRPPSRLSPHQSRPAAYVIADI